METAPPSLALGPQDVDSPVEHPAAERQVVLLPLELDDRGAQLVVRERRRSDVGVRGRLVRDVARALEERSLERRRRRHVDLERARLRLAAKAPHPLAAQRVDLLVQIASTARDCLLCGLGVAEQALEVVVAQTCEVGQRICGQVGTISLGDVDSSSPRAEGSTSA